MPIATSDPKCNCPEYETARRGGATVETLTRDLAECNFYGLRRLATYVMANQGKRESFSRDLARGQMVHSCPFPFEVALLRALHMGLARWSGTEESVEAASRAFMKTVRFGVMAPHLSSVVEYPAEVYFRAFQGVEVHRDVAMLEDAFQDAKAIDWMDFRIYGIPPLEKDFLWDLFLMDNSPWANPEKDAVNLAQSAVPESRERRLLPVMVARERNRQNAVGGRPIIGMATPGASLHLSLVSGNPAHIGDLCPMLLGAPVAGLPREPVHDFADCAGNVRELRDNDRWLIVTYNPPPPMADVRLMHVPDQMRTEEML